VVGFVLKMKEEDEKERKKERKRMGEKDAGRQKNG
jgi:hypothetical protein